MFCLLGVQLNIYTSLRHSTDAFIQSDFQLPLEVQPERYGSGASLRGPTMLPTLAEEWLELQSSPVQ